MKFAVLALLSLANAVNLNNDCRRRGCHAQVSAESKFNALPQVMNTATVKETPEETKAAFEMVDRDGDGLVT